MARISKEELKHKHLSELQVEATRRYRAKNGIKQLAISLNGDKLEAFNKKLRKEGLTKKQVIEAAIDNFLAN